LLLSKNILKARDSYSLPPALFMLELENLFLSSTGFLALTLARVRLYFLSLAFASSFACSHPRLCIIILFAGFRGSRLPLCFFLSFSLPLSLSLFLFLFLSLSFSLSRSLSLARARSLSRLLALAYPSTVSPRLLIIFH